MRQFLAGMVTMLLVIVLALAALLITLGQPGDTVSQAPLGPGVQPSTAPSDLGPDETWLGDVDLSSSSLVTPAGALRDVQAVGTNVRVTDSGLRVGQVVLDATLPFETAAEQIGSGVELYDAGGGLAGIRRTGSVLGIEMTVSATGRVTAENGNLVIEPQNVETSLPGLIDGAISAAARRLVTIRQSVEGLPEGLRLTDVSVAANGFPATLEGTDVLIAGAGS